MILFLSLLLLDSFLLGFALPMMGGITQVIVVTILYGTALYGLQYHGAKMAIKLIKRYDRR